MKLLIFTAWQLQISLVSTQQQPVCMATNGKSNKSMATKTKNQELFESKMSWAKFKYLD